MAIGQHHLTPLQLRQAQLNRQVLGNAQMYGPAVCQGRHLQRCQIGPSGVAEREAAADQSHETTVASLRSHAAHCFAEAFGYGLITDTQQSTGQLGVLFDRATQCDVFFITLKKSERLFSPSTRYRDLASREAATLITADRRLQLTQQLPHQSDQLPFGEIIQGRRWWEHSMIFQNLGQRSLLQLRGVWISPDCPSSRASSAALERWRWSGSAIALAR
jgi:hypothetical protein